MTCCEFDGGLAEVDRERERRKRERGGEERELRAHLAEFVDNCNADVTVELLDRVVEHVLAVREQDRRRALCHLFEPTANAAGGRKGAPVKTRSS